MHPINDDAIVVHLNGKRNPLCDKLSFVVNLVRSPQAGDSAFKKVLRIKLAHVASLLPQILITGSQRKSVTQAFQARESFEVKILNKSYAAGTRMRAAPV